MGYGHATIEEFVTGADFVVSGDFGDVDGDGLMDAVVLTALPNGVWFLRGGGATPPGIIAPSVAGSVRLVDLDLDGDEDLLLGDADIAWVRNDQRGVFGPREWLVAGLGATRAEARDLNGDGWLDLVVLGTQGLMLVPGIGAMAWGPEQLLTPTGNDFELADADGDGDVDIVAGEWAEVVSFSNDGGVFGPSTLACTGCLLGSLGDLDGDGDLDLASAREWLPNLGGFVFGPPNALPNSSYGDGVLADVDGDGDLDIAFDYAGVAVMVNDGAGGFAPPMDLPSCTGISSLQATRWDGDDRDDLVGLTGGYWLYGSPSVIVHSNVLVVDTDGDTLSDGFEVEVFGSDPTTPDTDGNGASDDHEHDHGTDPTDPTDDPTDDPSVVHSSDSGIPGGEVGHSAATTEAEHSGSRPAGHSGGTRAPSGDTAPGAAARPEGCRCGPGVRPRHLATVAVVALLSLLRRRDRDDGRAITRPGGSCRESWR